MNPDEQDYLRELAGATTVDFSALRFTATEAVTSDIRGIWRQHGLNIPSEIPAGLPHPNPRAIPPAH